MWVVGWLVARATTGRWLVAWVASWLVGERLLVSWLVDWLVEVWLSVPHCCVRLCMCMNVCMSVCVTTSGVMIHGLKAPEGLGLRVRELCTTAENGTTRDTVTTTAATATSTATAATTTATFTATATATSPHHSGRFHFRSMTLSAVSTPALPTT